jgi:hypothetical protein
MSILSGRQICKGPPHLVPEMHLHYTAHAIPLPTFCQSLPNPAILHTFPAELRGIFACDPDEVAGTIAGIPALGNRLDP